MLDDEIDGVEHDAVIIDQRQGALAMMRHLVEECGAQRVFFVGGPGDEHRHAGPLQGVSRHARARPGLKFNKEDVYYLGLTRTSRPIGWRWKSARDWAGPQHCVFAANDEMAAGIIAGAIAKQRHPCRAIWASSASTTRGSPR